MREKSQLMILIEVTALIAIEVVLSRFCSITTPLMKISVAFIPMSISAMLFGPAWAGVTGGVADFVGAILFPVGPYFPGFTLSNALYGVVLGLFLHRREVKWWHITLAVAINHLVLGVFLQSLWLHMLYGSPYLSLLPLRLAQGCLLTPIQIGVIYLMLSPVQRFARATRIGGAW